MGKKIEYDFRDGIDPDKIVFKDETVCNCKEAVYYILYLLLCWIWLSGWFALFFYAYIYYEHITFWVFIGCWIAFFGSWMIIAIINVCKYNERKRKKRLAKEKKEEEEKLQKEAEYRRINNIPNNTEGDNKKLLNNEN